MAAPIRHTNHIGHIGRLTTTTHQPADNLWVDELDQWAVSRASWAFPQTQLDFSKFSFPTREWWRWTSQLLILSSGANCARYLVRLHLVQETIFWGEEIYIWVFILKFHSIHKVLGHYWPAVTKANLVCNYSFVNLFTVIVGKQIGVTPKTDLLELGLTEASFLCRPYIIICFFRGQFL